MSIGWRRGLVALKENPLVYLVVRNVQHPEAVEVFSVNIHPYSLYEGNSNNNEPFFAPASLSLSKKFEPLPSHYGTYFRQF